MSIQTTLNKDESYGQVIGVTHNGAVYAQNNLEFDNKGKRVTPLTDAERKAEQKKQEASRKREEAEEIEYVAKTAIINIQKEETEKAAELAGPKEPNPEMPDFGEPGEGWTKSEMVHHARNKFNVSINPQKTRDQIKAQLEELYG